MSCKECGKEITSKITGELCTSCYFKSKKNESDVVVVSDNFIKNLKDNETKEISKEITPSSEQVTSDSTKKIEKCGKKLDDDIFCQNAATEEITVKGKIVKICVTCANDMIEHIPAQVKHVEVPQDGKKYCQSCIERYGNLVEATREWTPDYFICDDCLTPLLNNQLGLSNTKEIARIKTSIKINNPALEQIYTLLEVPEHLRFKSSDEVSMNYNGFFNHHASANINLNLDQLKERVEFLQTIFETIRQEIHPITDRINQLKHAERAKNNLTSVEGSRAKIKGPSKIKMSALEKEAKAMGLTVEQYQKFIEETRKAAFDKIVGK